MGKCQNRQRICSSETVLYSMRVYNIDRIHRKLIKMDYTYLYDSVLFVNLGGNSATLQALASYIHIYVDG